MMLDHLRVLRLSCRHHGARRQCGGRGERAGVVIHLESVVPPLPNSPIFDSLSAQIGCAEVVNGRRTLTLFVRTWAYGQPLNLADESRTSPGSGRHFARHRGHCAHSGVVRLSGALGVITCWANTRVGLIVM